MINNRYNGDEPNVEGLVGEFLSRMPWDDPQACREIILLLTEETDRFNANRAARLRREAELLERDDDE
jgi:hypothetical protein